MTTTDKEIKYSETSVYRTRYDRINRLFQHCLHDSPARVSMESIPSIKRFVPKGFISANDRSEWFKIERSPNVFFFGRGSPRMLFRIHQPLCSQLAICCCELIESSSSHKLFGLFIDTDMKNTSHVDEVRANLHENIVVLARIRKAVFHALIDSHMNYVSAVIISRDICHF